MPSFYNLSIHLLQYRVLRRWLHASAETTVLEIGCGVGRWSRRLARAGAVVTGVDLAPTMVLEAQRRAKRQGIEARCRFLVGDVAELDLGTRFDRILGVTVLQHVLDPERFEASVQRLAAHLAPGGQAVLLEAAPSRSTSRCDSAVFVARQEHVYQQAFRRAGLRCVAVHGVDPAPFKTWFLPWYRIMPRPLAVAGLAVVTAATVPVDLLLARRVPDASWHKLFVLTRDNEGSNAEPPRGKP